MHQETLNDNLMDNLDESDVDFATYVELTNVRGRPTRGRIYQYVIP